MELEVTSGCNQIKCEEIGTKERKSNVRFNILKKKKKCEGAGGVEWGSVAF